MDQIAQMIITILCSVMASSGFWAYWTKITSGEIMTFGASGACKGKDKFISVNGHTAFIGRDFEKSAYSYDGFT